MRQKLVIRLIVYVPLIAMVIMSGRYIVRQMDLVIDQANRLLISELNQRLGREVRVRRTSVKPWGTAVLEGVEVASDKRLAQGRMLTIPRLIVHYDLRALIMGGKGAQSVSTVTLEQPMLNLIRRPDGSFNILELLPKRKGPSGPPFAGRVDMRGATVTFTDHLAGVGKAAAVNLIRNVDADLDAGRQPLYAFSVSASGSPGRFTLARAVGTYNSKNRTADIDVTGEGASASYWSHYFNLARSIDIQAGTAKVVLGVHYQRATGKSRTAFAGAIDVNEGVVNLPMFTQPVKQVEGKVAISDQRVLLSLSGTVGNTKATVAGSVTDFAKPKLSLLATSKRADFAGLMGSLKVPKAAQEIHPKGVGPLQVLIGGSAASPVIEAVGTIPSMSLRGYNPDQVSADAVYQDGRIEFHSLRFGLLDGRFAGKGSISLNGTPVLAIQGRADGVKLSKLPLPSGVEGSGRGSASFVVSGPISDPKVSANVTVSRVQVAGIPFEAGAAMVEYKSGAFKVSRLQAVGGPVGSVSVQGSVTSKSMDLTVTSEGSDLQRFAQLLALKAIQGTGFLKARITGTPSKPRFTAEVELYDGSYLGYPIDYAMVSIAGGTQRVRIKEAVLGLYPAEIRFSGQVGRLDADRIPFQLDGKLDRFAISKLSEMLGRPLDAGGTLSGTIETSGLYSRKAGKGESPFVEVAANASVRLQDGTIFKMPISDATAELSYASNTLKITEAHITSQGATVSVEKLNEDEYSSLAVDTGDVKLMLKLNALDLARIKDRIEGYARVGGVLSATVSVNGTVSDPVADVQAQVEALSVSSRRFDVARLTAGYSDDLVTAFKVALERGKQSFSVEGTKLDPKTMKLESAKGTIDNVSVPDLWGIVTDSPYLRSTKAEGLSNALDRMPRITQGALSGSFEVSGSLARPTGHIDLSAGDILLDIRKIESAKLVATADDGKVTLNDLRLKSQDAVVTVGGGLNIPDKTLNLDVMASYLDLSALKSWLGDKTPGGVMQADFTVSGSMGAPAIVGSVDIVKPSYAGLIFDGLRATGVEVKSDRIEFTDIMLASGGHQVLAGGHVPWDWPHFTIPPTQPLDLTVLLKQQSLTALGSFGSGWLDQTKTAGTIEGKLSVAGTMSKPELSGSLDIHDGVLAFKYFDNEFTNINVDLAFSGDRVRVDRFLAASSLGGTIKIAQGGYVAISDLAESVVDLKLIADGLVLAERNGLGFKEDVNTRIDAGMSMTGSLASPLVADLDVDTDQDGKTDITGGISINKSNIAFATAAGKSKPFSLELPVDPRFNVSLRVGTNVWVFPPSMGMHVLGSGSLKGKLSKPEFGLGLQVVEGNMRLAGSRLSVVPGGTIDIAFAPPRDPVLRVNFKAYTSVTAANQFGKSQRYRIDMIAKGTVGNLQVGLASNPGGLTREQMLASLGRVEGILNAESQFQKELGNVLTAVGTSTLFAPIESVFTNKLGFEQFTLEYAVDKPLALYMSRHLLSNFYLSYYGRLTSSLANVKDANYEVNLGYLFADKYFFSLGMDNQTTTSLQAQYTIHF